jgi:hypothetical protein
MSRSAHRIEAGASKVANLQNDIREQLNLRLLEGETARELAAWLNALPEVQTILNSQFNGSAISEVNLTHWRQGGYLQWLTEREYFDSARALADGDSAFAETGLSAERLLNMLTLRFGQLLMRWDFNPDESVSDAAEPIGVGAGVGAGGCPGKGGRSRKEASHFNVIARKARILQGISRSVLAIHRIQSQSPREKREPASSSFATHADLTVHGAPAPKTLPASHRPTAVKTDAEPPADPALNALLKSAFRKSQIGAGAIPKILSGPITPSIVALKLPRAQLNTDPTLSEFLEAV